MFFCGQCQKIKDGEGNVVKVNSQMDILICDDCKEKSLNTSGDKK